MKAIQVQVLLSVASFHQPIEPLTVDTDAKTIKGTVNTFTDEASSQVEGAVPLKVSQYIAPMVDGLSDEDCVDQYLNANIASVIGGALPPAPAAAPVV